MKRITKLINDYKFSWKSRHCYRIKWRIEHEHKDIPVCSIFCIPTIVFNPYPYRRPGTFVFNVYFLHWYLGIGEWGYKE